MKNSIYILLFSILLMPKANAQDALGKILESVETNNTTLKAYREQANANKIANKTGINMANPEVEFGYGWGSPSTTGSRQNLSVTQSFDFPTAYRYKSQLANERNKQVDLNYEQQRKEVLHEARLICVQLAFLSKQQEQLRERVKYAKELAEAYEKSFELGNTDILERNKAKLDLLNMEKALQMIEVDINMQKSELVRMNGGEALSFSVENYPDYLFPLNFSDWFVRIKNNNPLLIIAEQEVELSRKQEKLTRALNLPKLSAGYSGEFVKGSSYQGVTVGISIPLWEGKNTVKQQKAQTIALQMQQEDTKLQFQNQLHLQYDRAYKLSILLKEYEETLALTNNRELLKKALDKGQLSLINYLLELGVYYETIDKYLETERDYQLAVAELMQWEN